MEESKDITTLEEIKAINDPYRLQIIFCFQRMGRAATVKEIADNMGEVPAKVHYHVKKLESAGILKLSHTKNVNGIIAKYYELTARDFHIRASNLDSDISKKVASQNVKLTLMAAYESSKKIVIEDIPEDTSVSLGTHTLYLTDEKAKELKAMLREFVKANKVNRGVEGASEYHFFNVLAPVKSIKK